MAADLGDAAEIFVIAQAGVDAVGRPGTFEQAQGGQVLGFVVAEIAGDKDQVGRESHGAVEQVFEIPELDIGTDMHIADLQDPQAFERGGEFGEAKWDHGQAHSRRRSVDSVADAYCA